MSEALDGELLDAWRDGDRRAGDELVTRHWASIARFVRGKVGDDAASDVIAQIFLACVESRDHIDELRPYLFATARRRMADHFRRRARQPALDFAVSSLVDLRTGLVTAVDRKERGELLREGLAKISLDDQIALELAYFENLSTRELSAALEIPENTVRSRLSRARDKLRETIGDLADALDDRPP